MIKSLFQTSIVSYLGLCLTMLGSILVARHYGPTGQGELAALLLIPQMVINFGDLGISESIMYHLSKKTSVNILTKKMIIKIYTIIFCLMLILFSSYLLIFSYSDTFLTMSMGYIYIMLLFSNQILSFINRGYLRFKIFNLGILILNSAVFLSILLCVTQNLSVKYLFFSYLLSNTIYISFMLVKTKLHMNTPETRKEYSLKEVFLYGIKTYSYKVLNSAESQFDKFMIASFLVSSQLGLYSVAVVLSSSLYLFLVKPIASIILPILNKIEDINEKQELITLINKIIFWIGVIFGIVLFLLSKTIIYYIYGAEYLPVLMPLWILLLGVILKSPMSILAYYFKSIGTPEIMVRISIITVILNISAGIIFIPSFGIKAAAIISTITYTIYSILLSRKYVKNINKGYLSQYLFNKTEINMIVNYAQSLALKR